MTFLWKELQTSDTSKGTSKFPSEICAMSVNKFKNKYHLLKHIGTQAVGKYIYPFFFVKFLGLEGKRNPKYFQT